MLQILCSSTIQCVLWDLLFTKLNLLRILFSFTNNIVFLPDFTFVNFTRHVVLPKELVQLFPRAHLLTETEWRGIGVQQSPGWIHYMNHAPGKTRLLTNLIFDTLGSFKFHISCPLNVKYYNILRFVRSVQDMIFIAEPHILLFRRLLKSDSPTQ